jgi:hypothetical protein
VVLKLCHPPDPSEFDSFAVQKFVHHRHGASHFGDGEPQPRATWYNAEVPPEWPT